MITSSEQLNLSPQQKRLWELEDKLRLLKKVVQHPSSDPSISMAVHALQAAYLWPVLTERLINEAEDVVEHAVHDAIHDALTPRFGPQIQESLSCIDAITSLHHFGFLDEAETQTLIPVARAADSHQLELEHLREREVVIAARRRRIQNEAIKTMEESSSPSPNNHSTDSDA